MSRQSVLGRGFLVVALAVVSLLGAQLASAAQDGMLEKDSQAALKHLYEQSATAKALGAKAKAILVFPDVRKAGFILGGQGGEGVLMVNNKITGYYETAAVSVGLQAGAQSFAYVIFFMTDSVFKHFRDSKNFEIGVGPNIVFIDQGAAKDVNTLTAKSDVYAIIFGQKGLMAGIGLQGSKITKIDR